MGSDSESSGPSLRKCDRTLAGPGVRFSLPRSCDTPDIAPEICVDLFSRFQPSPLPPSAPPQATAQSQSISKGSSTQESPSKRRTATPGTIKDLIATAQEAPSPNSEELVLALRGIRDISKLGLVPCQCIVKQGGIAPLVTQLSTGDLTRKQLATFALLNLSLHRPLRPAIVQAQSKPQIITSLVKVLTSELPQLRARAAAVLTGLASVPGVAEELAKLGAVPLLASCLSSINDLERKDALGCLLRLSAVKTCRISFVKNQVPAELCLLLRTHKYTHDEQVAGIFSSLPCEPEGREALVSCKAIPVLVELLECGSTPLAKHHALVALWELATQMPECVDEIEEEDADAGLARLAESDSAGTVVRSKALGLQALLQHSRGQKENCFGD